MIFSCQWCQKQNLVVRVQTSFYYLLNLCSCNTPHCHILQENGTNTYKNRTSLSQPNSAFDVTDQKQYGSYQPPITWSRWIQKCFFQILNAINYTMKKTLYWIITNTRIRSYTVHTKKPTTDIYTLIKSNLRLLLINFLKWDWLLTTWFQHHSLWIST